MSMNPEHEPYCPCEYCETMRGEQDEEEQAALKTLKATFYELRNPILRDREPEFSLYWDGKMWHWAVFAEYKNHWSESDIAQATKVAHAMNPKRLVVIDVEIVAMIPPLPIHRPVRDMGEHVDQEHRERMRRI